MIPLSLQIVLKIFIFEKSLSGDGYNLYVMDDWHSLSRVASVRVDASLPVAYYSVPGGDDPELMDENMLDNESGILALTQLTPYNTTCTMENGHVAPGNVCPRYEPPISVSTESSGSAGAATDARAAATRAAEMFSFMIFASFQG